MNDIDYTPINRASTFAQRAQKDCVYGELDEPYDVHNKNVRAVLRRFGYKEGQYTYFHVGAELHDVFEDTEVTPGDARKAGLNERGIQLAVLVTDEPGENRKERKVKTYPKIASDPEGIALKLADRIANIEYRGTKMKMYKAEYPEFRKALYQADKLGSKMNRMWKYLDTIML